MDDKPLKDQKSPRKHGWPPLHRTNAHDNEPEGMLRDYLQFPKQHIEQDRQKTNFNHIWKELQEIRDKYVILYDFAPAGYATLDSSGLILEANLTLADLLGIEKQYLHGSKLAHYICQEYQETFFSHFNTALENGAHQTYEIQMIRQDGSLFFAGLENIAIRDPEDYLSQCFTTISVISDRLKYEELSRFQSTIANICCDAIIVTDRELNITRWNKAAEDIFGWAANEMLGKRASSQIHSQILGPLARNKVLKCMEENSNWSGEATIQKKDGTKIDTLTSIGVFWDRVGNFNGVVAIYRDMTKSLNDKQSFSEDEIERRVKLRTEELVKANRILQQEIALHKQTALLAKESEGKNRDLVDNIKLGIFRSTPGIKGKFLEVNKAMEEITGYSRGDLLQIDVCELYSKTTGNPINNEVNINDWKVTRELDLRKKDGSQIMVAVTVVAIRFDSGSIQYYDGILEDVTESRLAQKQIQDSLQRLQKTIREIIEAMAYIGEVRDPYTAGHQRRVAQLSFEIAKVMGLSDDQDEGLTMAAFVHDIGKILVPADILSKPGKLTKPEFDMLKDHTRIGYEILRTIEFPWPIATIVLQHHERLDGSGYPSGLSGNQIIIEARILAVADVVEAMASHRPYRPALGIQPALDEINHNRGTLYDSNVVDACVKVFNEKGFSLN